MHIARADDSSSLLASTPLQIATFPGTQVVTEVTVNTARLDAVVDQAELVRPVLLKIDVQGTELEVLRGATGLLDIIDTVLIECSFAELYAGQALADNVICLMYDSGFRLDGMMAPTADSAGNVLQADLIFERRAG